MKLVSAKVALFRNILESGQVQFQPDVTCLVGKNESGKTAFLNALYRLNPARPNVSFNAQKQYPAWLEKQHRRQGRNPQEAVPIEATFELEDADKASLEKRFGSGVLASKEVQVKRAYAGNPAWTVPINVAAVVRGLVQRLDIGPEAKQRLEAVNSVECLTEAIADLKGRVGDEAEPLRAAGTALERSYTDLLKGAGSIADAIVVAVQSITPTFFYFDDYATLPGIVKIRELLAADPSTLDDDRLTARALLGAAAAEGEYLLNPEYETRKRELENVANAITAEVLKYWTTNPDLRVTIDITQVNEAAPKGGQQTVLDELHIRLYDDRHLLSLPFDERSTGFRWFFSFLAAFSAYLYDNRPVILLLDEPGLGLHARAQKDFLRFIDERLSARCQVVYTTHSPFMVQPGKLERARVVEDRGREIGSVVSQDILTTDPDTLFPLQGALGYDLAQHLFIGQNNLVIEGTSDFAYLTLFSDFLKEKSRKALDEHWTLVPVGGADMVPTFVALLGVHLDVTVLVDSRKEGHQRLSQLAQKGYLKATRIVTVGEMIARKTGDVEDLFTPDDYLVLYNRAFGRAVRITDLVGSDSIVNQIARFEGIDRFDHGKPADLLLRNRNELLPKMSALTLENFEKLIERVNKTLPTE